MERGGGGERCPTWYLEETASSLLAMTPSTLTSESASVYRKTRNSRITSASQSGMSTTPVCDSKKALLGGSSELSASSPMSLDSSW